MNRLTRTDPKPRRKRNFIRAQPFAQEGMGARDSDAARQTDPLADVVERVLYR